MKYELKFFCCLCNKGVGDKGLLIQGNLYKLPKTNINTRAQILGNTKWCEDISREMDSNHPGYRRKIQTDRFSVEENIPMNVVCIECLNEAVE